MKNPRKQKKEPPNPKALPPEKIFFATVLAWFVPGAGHWMLKMRGKAIAYFVTVMGMFITGAALGKFSIVSFKYHPYAFLLHACTGVVSIVMTMITSALPEEVNPTRWGDIGLTLTWIAAALNVLLIADVFDRANGGPFEQEKPKPSYTRRALQWIFARKKCSST